MDPSKEGVLLKDVFILSSPGLSEKLPLFAKCPEPIFPPARSQCLYVNSSDRELVHSEVSVLAIGRTHVISLCLS